MKILLVCSDGISTSLIESAIKKYLSENNAKGEIKAVDPQSGLKLAKNFDVTLLAPQIAFMLEEFKKIVEGKSVGLIDPTDYDIVDVNSIIIKAKELVNKN